MRDINYLTSKGVDINTSLELFGDINTYNDTLGEFIISATEKIGKLEEYKNNKDMANFAIYVHSLKSDSKYFGFMTLSNLALELEQKSKAGDALYVTDKFPTLKEQATDAVAVAKEYLYGTGETPAEPAAPAAPAPQPQEPVAQPAPQPVQAAPAAQPAAVTPAAGEVYDKPTILVVDDSNIIRSFVKKIFSENYGVGTAQNGQEAIDIINSNINNNNIVAILLDLNMPGVDGFAVLEYMQQNSLFQKMPVSIISGDSSKETIDKSFAYSIVDMLGKPFNEQGVKNIVEKTMMYRDMA